MPMPHRTQMQLIKRRLIGKEGAERVRELRAILAELPDYRNGPYADIRKWVEADVVQTRLRARVVARDTIEVRRQGAAQIALVGAPNVGKSTLLQALSDIQIKTGDYAFTTTRPVAAVTRIEGVEFQLVEIPGLIEGASQGRGGGRALLGVLRHADGIVLCHDARRPVDDFLTIRRVLEEAGIDLPCLMAATRYDEAPGQNLRVLQRVLTDLEVIPVSVLDDESLGTLRAGIWRLSGLMRVYLRKDGDDNLDPLAFRPPVRVIDVATAIHHDLGKQCVGARIWGRSARFDSQKVGAGYLLADGDRVEILS
jgi:small GTP-binding protein